MSADQPAPPSPRAAARPKVLVAMSGGVDSSVAAALLQQQGYDCIGVFMRLGSPGEALDELLPGGDAPCPATPNDRPLKIGRQGCCSINDAADARLVAAQLGIPFYVVNFKSEFGRIIDYFVDEYAAGRTPNPCVRCNDWLKFGRLHDYAAQLGADFIASGHYARIEAAGRRSDQSTQRRSSAADVPMPAPDARASRAPDAGPEEAPRRKSGPAASTPTAPPPLFRLLRGLDHAKDQSYVLFGMPRAQLARTLLPIGGYTKAAIRQIARDLGLPVFDKPDSQEICFVPDNDYAALVERRRPHLAAPGPILDPDGNRLGDHDGHHHFTIGQRRGVGLALGHRLYVVDKDPRANTVTLGPRERLRIASCTADEANWLIEPPPPEHWRTVLARYRSNGALVPARVRVLADALAAHTTPGHSAAPTPSGRIGRFEVAFDQPQEAVAPGQALVLYDAADPDAVLGGGWIDAATRAEHS